VRVRCIIDGAGSFGFSGNDVARMKSAGVLLSVFHPVGPWRRRWGWQVRDHRKLLIVDGASPSPAGINLGDDYAPVVLGRPGMARVHAEIEGPSCASCSGSFEVLSYAEPENWDPALPAATRRSPEQLAIHGSTTRVQALAVGRFMVGGSCNTTCQHAMAMAGERIWIEAAYFIPNRALRGTLKRAARRGVDVRVIVPRHSDIPGMADASRATWTSLLKAGVRIFEWLPGMLHAKTLTIDGSGPTVGSYNLDSRSLLYNWEVTLEVLDERLAEQLEEKFRDDLESCEQVDPEEFRRRGPWSKLRERFFYFFRVWL